jgi:GGDEF domain-containing protein
LNAKKILSELVDHDGLHDTLTGLLAHPAFIESATREVASNIRSKETLNLFLISLLHRGDERSEKLAVNYQNELSRMPESEIHEIAARMLEGANILRQEFRQGDLIARYTFADFLLLNNGNFETIKKKIEDAISGIKASVVGIKMDFTSGRGRQAGASETLRSGISTLEVLQMERFPT